MAIRIETVTYREFRSVTTQADFYNGDVYLGALYSKRANGKHKGWSVRAGDRKFWPHARLEYGSPAFITEDDPYATPWAKLASAQVSHG